MERPRMSTKMSDLTIGTGKITPLANRHQLELQLSPRDYTSMVTYRSRPHDVFSLIQIDRRQHKEAQSDEKGTAVVLPKTYVTRSGPLFLYSDSKVMRDNQETRHGGLNKTLPLSVHGRAVPKPTKPAESCPNWGQLLAQKPKSNVCSFVKMSTRDRRNYLGVTKHHDPRSYVWNYAITPAKLFGVAGYDHLKTVHNLSEAILTYDHCIPSGSEWSPSTDTRNIGVRQTGIGSRSDTTLSNWTRAWLNTDELMSINCKGRAKSARRADVDPELLEIERARTSLTMRSNMADRAPANTPLSMVQGSTRSRQKVGRRVKSSISKASTVYSRIKTPTSCQSYPDDLENETV